MAPRSKDEPGAEILEVYSKLMALEKTEWNGILASVSEGNREQLLSLLKKRRADRTGTPPPKRKRPCWKAEVQRLRALQNLLDTADVEHSQPLEETGDKAKPRIAVDTERHLQPFIPRLLYIGTRLDNRAIAEAHAVALSSYMSFFASSLFFALLHFWTTFLKAENGDSVTSTSYTNKAKASVLPDCVTSARAKLRSSIVVEMFLHRYFPIEMSSLSNLIPRSQLSTFVQSGYRPPSHMQAALSNFPPVTVWPPSKEILLPDRRLEIRTARLRARRADTRTELMRFRRRHGKKLTEFLDGAFQHAAISAAPYLTGDVADGSDFVREVNGSLVSSLKEIPRVNRRFLDVFLLLVFERLFSVVETAWRLPDADVGSWKSPELMSESHVPRQLNIEDLNLTAFLFASRIDAPRFGIRNPSSLEDVFYPQPVFVPFAVEGNPLDLSSMAAGTQMPADGSKPILDTAINNGDVGETTPVTRSPFSVDSFGPSDPNQQPQTALDVALAEATREFDEVPTLEPFTMFALMKMKKIPASANVKQMLKDLEEEFEMNDGASVVAAQMHKLRRTLSGVHSLFALESWMKRDVEEEGAEDEGSSSEEIKAEPT